MGGPNKSATWTNYRKAKAASELLDDPRARQCEGCGQVYIPAPFEETEILCMECWNRVCSMDGEDE